VTTLLARSPSAPTPWRAALPVLGLAVGALAGYDPLLGLAAALGIAYVAVVLADLTLGVLMFCGLTFIDEIVLESTTRFPLAKGAGALLALSWLIAVATRRPERRFGTAHPRAAYLMVLFVAWTVLSVLWAEDSGLATTTVSRYALNLVLVPIIYTAIRTRRDVHRLLVVIVLGTVVSAAYGIVREAGQTGGDARLYGAGVDPNTLASLLIAGAVIALALAVLPGRSASWRGAALAAAAFCGVAVLLTGSRAGLVSLAVVVLAGLFLAGRGRRLPVLGAAILLVTVTVIYFAAFAPAAATHRVTHPGTGSGREDIWLVGWRMVQAHPLTGVGAGNFPISSIHYLLQPGTILRDDYIVVPKVAHNIYLGTLAELGVVGLALFCGILGWALSCGWRAARRFDAMGARDMGTVSRAVLIALLGILTASAFASGQFSKPLWVLIGLCPCLLALSRHDEEPMP
jgi:O-antigen ligase